MNTKVELFQFTGDEDGLISNLIDIVRQKGIVSVDLEFIGDLGEDPDLEFYDSDVTVDQAERIDRFVEATLNQERSKKMGRFILSPTIATLRNGEYAQFRGDVYDTHNRHPAQYEAFSCFFLNEQGIRTPKDAILPSLNGKLLFLLMSNQAD